MITKLKEAIKSHRWLIISALVAYAAATGLVQCQSYLQDQTLQELQSTAERIKFKLKLVGIEQ